MGAVDFPRDEQGRIIVHPPVAAPAEGAPPPAASRPIRALDPGAHVSMDLPGAPAAADRAGAPSLSRAHLAGACALALLVAAVLIARVMSATPAPAAGPLAQQQPTAHVPTLPPTTAAPTLVPTALPLPVLAWRVDAFDAGGQYVGPLDAGRTYTVTGRIDATWLAIEAPAWSGAPASGPVRIRAVDLVTQPLAYGPTATPPPAPQPVYVYVEVPAAAPAPATVAPATPVPAQRNHNQIGERPNLNPGPRSSRCGGATAPAQCEARP